MKNILKINIIIPFLLFSLWSSAIGSSGFNNTRSDDNKIELLSSKGESTIIKCTINSYDKESVQTDKGQAYTISAEKATSLLMKGAPDLPKLASSIIIPDNAKMKIEVIDSKFIEIDNIDIAPSKGNITRNIDPNSISYTYSDVYNQNRFFPENIAELNNPYILRQYRGQTVVFQPFAYNPVTKVLRVYTEITVEVSAIKGEKGTVNVLDRTSKSLITDSEFKNVYKNQFLNYRNDSKYEILEEQGNMLIIAPSKYMDAMEEFVIWKKQKGISTELVELSQIGTSADNIKNYVAEYYANKGLSYLLLVGDGEDIPSVIVEIAYGDTPYGHSDNAYGYLAGDDSYPEIFVGRFSAESVSDVETQVRRTIHYEKELLESDTWLGNGIGIASAEGGESYSDDGETDAEHMENIRKDLMNYGYIDVKQIYDPGASASTVSAAINNGVSIINYIGHGLDNLWGTTYYSNYQVDNLVNDNKLPFIISVACLNGAFHGQTCFAESWLRATNNGNPTGAVAMIASTINQNWAPPMDAQDEMVDILIESYENNIKRTFGGITFNGSMHMLDQYSDVGKQDADTWTIFGDPSLNVRTKTPVKQTVEHSDILYMGMEQFVVNGDEGSFVSLTINNEILGTGIVQNGVANINFDPVEVHDTMQVTITGYNKVTYIAEVPIVPANSPYIIVKNFNISDVSGNNNGIADFEENILFNVNYENITDLASGFDASNVVATLSTDDPFVTITNNLNTVGDIPCGTELLKTDAFTLIISSTIPDKHVVKFNVEIKGDYLDSTYTWNSQINIKVNAPSLITGELVVDDSETGNNNGILDNGETANIIIPVNNLGSANIVNVNGELEIISAIGDIIVNSGTYNVGDIASQQNASFIFNVTASESAELHTMVDLKVNITGGVDGKYNSSHANVIFIGDQQEYLISQEGVVSTCYGYFLDSGGKDDKYSNSENYVMTIKPGAERSLTKVEFTEFDIESSNGGSCFDQLSVYDGEDINAELIGVYCNANIPDIIIATSPSGALTFEFNSDSDFSKNGWNAEISCVDAVDNLLIFNITDGLNPIENVSITIDNRNFVTDQSGKVSFYIENGIYDYTIEADGYVNVENKIDVNSSDITENIALEVEKYEITFNIIDENSNPLDANVTLNSETKTAVEGKVVFKELLYQLNAPVKIECESYVTESSTINITNSKTINIKLEPTKAKVNFNVTLDENPFQGVYVTVVSVDAKSYYGVSNADGIAEFDLMNGTYNYIISATGYDNHEGTFTLADTDLNFDIAYSKETGIDDLNNSGFSVYPNPTTGNFLVKFDSDAQNAIISILDMNGRVIYSENTMKNEDVSIDLSGKPNGLYLVQLNVNGELFTERIILSN